MARRSKAREVALQMLFQKDFNPDADAYQLRQMIGEQIDDADLAAFCWSLVAGVLERLPELDARISAAAENWSLDRMAPTDRNALRIGAYEMLCAGTPPRVVIDEAIELARKFGTAQSPQFVNGILDRLMPEKPTSSAEESL